LPPSPQTAPASTVTLTATVSPASNGTVSFFSGSTQVGTTQTVSTANSVAKVMTTPPVGTPPYLAKFTPTTGSGVIGSTSSTIDYVVNEAPAVTLQPSSVTAVAGTSVSFTAAATGSPTPTVQWQVSSNGGATWTNIAGATSATLTFTAATNNAKQYRAVFTNPAGSATTNTATLTVTTPDTDLTIATPANITKDATGPSGATVTYSAPTTPRCRPRPARPRPGRRSRSAPPR
jgi:hypothetical protein